MVVWGAILWKDNLLKAEQEGLLKVENRLEYSSCSLDVRIGKLFKEKRIRVTTQDQDWEMGQEEFIEKRLEEIDFTEGFIPEPHERYFWQPMETVFLEKGLTGEIATRSSWARLGVHVQSDQIDDYFLQGTRARNWTPLCQLRTWTRVLLKPGDAIGHMLIATPAIPFYVSNDEMAHLINQGVMEITKEGRVLSACDLAWHGHPVLTMGPNLKIYTGQTLVPGSANEGAFEEVSIGRFKRERFPKGTFFISASDEYIKIPPEFAGYVTSSNSLMTMQYLARDAGTPPFDMWHDLGKVAPEKIYAKIRDSEFTIMPFQSHSNAPYIWPAGIFEGHITFENLTLQPTELYRGMKQAELCLIPFVTPCIDSQESRYNKQSGATESKADHLGNV